MTPQELKSSILQLAIQGKLVEQRPEEGTATPLLEAIEVDRTMQIKSKQAKSKRTEPIIDNDIPFDIPESWTWARFGHIANYTMGKTPPRAEAQWWGDGLPWVSIADMPESGHVRQTKETVTNIAVSEKFGNRISKAGTLIMSFKLTVGRVSILDIDAVHNEAIISIYPFADQEDIMKAYLFHILPFVTQYGDSKNAIKGKTLNDTSISNLLIPLPPLAEQKRIVAKIEELLPYIDRYEQAWSRLEEFNKRFPNDMRKSILQLAIQGKLVEQRPEEGTAKELYCQIQEEKRQLIKIGKIRKGKLLPEITEDYELLDIPASWMWVSIGNVCVNIQYGSSKKSSASGKVAVLRMGNIQDGRIALDKLVYTSDDEEIIKYPLQHNDLLFNRTNSKDLVGKTAIYKSEIPAIYAGYLVRITPVLIDSDYLNYVMQSRFYWSYCQRVRSDAIGQSNINAEKLKRFVFPLPPLAEQKRIVAKLEELLLLCEHLK